MLLLETAFSVDTSAITPTVDDNGDSMHIVFQQDEDISFIVDYDANAAFPTTVYAFSHPNDTAQIDVATDDSFTFDTALIPAAQNFVQELYGVDCSEADTSAYGYQNKLAVQLQVTPTEIFSVRFYYEDSTPTGILFFSDADTAQQSMDTNHAKKFA